MGVSQGKRSWVGEGLAIGVSLLVLFVICVESWGQCTLGSRAGGYPDGPWVGDWVPKSIFPVGAWIPSDKEYGKVVIRYASCGYEFNEGWNKYNISACDQVLSGADAVYSFLVPYLPDCDTYDGLMILVCYDWKDGVYNDHDYDCDGVPDSADSHPAEPEDRAKNVGCPDGLCDIFVGNPANVATGNKYEEVLDLSVSTPGLPLEFRRFYNNQVSSDGPLGYGWTHTYDVLLEVFQTNPTKRIRIWDSDGRALYFTENSRTTEIIFSGESGVKDRLKQIISTGEYFLRRKEGSLTYKFASNGKLLEISDPNGNRLTLSYTGGLLTQVSDNFGKSLSIQYNVENRISSITDPKGQSILYEYLNGDLTKVTYPDLNFTRYAYSNHHMTDKYDTNNNLIGHWEYDTWDRVKTYYSHLKEGVLQERIDLSYELQKTKVTRPTGTTPLTTTYITAIIDGINVVKEIEGCSTCGSVHKRFQYSNRLDLTHVTSISDGQQYTTQYTYGNPTHPWEQVGEILEIKEALGWPEGRTTLYSYTHRTDDPFLLTQGTETISSVVNPQQYKVITTTYNNQGNILSLEEKGYVLIDGVPTQKTYRTEYQYNTLGQLTQINGPRTDVRDITTFEYYENIPGEGNNRGQLKAIVNALGQKTAFSDYDANGNVGRITDPNKVITQRTYDERNRIKTITNLSTEAQTQYFYDSRGNLSYIILPEGNRIDFSYNLANKLIEIRDSLGNKIEYHYDVEGNRTREETKDPQGTLKKYLDFTYDAYNNLKKIINPDSTYTEYTYDGRKNPISSKDPKNNTITYTYDALSRIKQMTQPLSTITGYGYDTQDNQASITDPNGNITLYHYDDFGRRNQTTSPDTGITKYLYDEAGNLIQRADAKGTVVNYTYDALNRLTVIQLPSDPNQNITFTYDSPSVFYGIGRLTGRVDPSGTYTFYYDAHGNLTREDKTIGGILYSTHFTYNDNNVLTSITYPTGRTITYTLDQTGRISQVSTTLNGNPKTLASAIDYLPYGGITGLTYGNGLSLSQGYDTQHRISSIVVGSIINMTYGYDPNGNITSILDAVNPPGGEVVENPETYTYQQGTNRLTRIEGTSPVDFGYDANGDITIENNWTYVYDLSDQLIRVLDNTNQIAEYVYNGAGQRIKKVTQTETRIFHYDPMGHLIAETNQSGQMLAEYIYLGDQLLAMIKLGELVYYFHNDHLGTPQVLTNDSGSIAWKAAYTPFGQADVRIGSVENNIRLSGQYYDGETGFHYNYFRYYDPTTGRYITPDPIGLEAGDINLYPYVGDDPMNRIDPWGLWEKDVHSGIGNLNYGTYIWAKQLGIRDQEAKIIALGNVGTDGGYSSWMPILGLQSRHFNQLQPGMKAFQDSREYWANVELRRAVDYYKKGNCEAAYGHLGKGLHSVQEMFAHRDWDTGWHGMLRHPDWYDIWNDPRNRLARELTEKNTKEYLYLFLRLTGQR